ncbi:HIRAN domain-containing protein [Rhizobium halophilum]|uniref:HIRAN domain-containing protein n=1 Tax=Rhizobium halophilum TaxID=2846852 RepID=UPI001EFC9D04|nr:HIRAN domain-containing protein [Rhizobium halophilum]MCF6367486.1 HIRAN domain-containing protein [Rhizobium halophilum]
MERRSFLAGAGGTLAALPFATGAAAAARGEAGGVGLLRSYVANRDQFPHAKAPEANEVLHLERRPERAFDPSSVAVRRRDGSQLGYLPSTSTGILAALLDQGFDAYAIALPGTTGSEIPVQVYLNKDLSRVHWTASA